MVQEFVQALRKSGLDLQELAVPEGITEIETAACMGMAQLKIVRLPKSLRKIGTLAFYGCIGLEHIELPKDLKEIGTAAFKGSGVKEITVPLRVHQMGSEVFADTPLRAAELKSGCTGVAMFRGCAQLKKVTLGETVHALADGMFRDCTALRTLRLPEGLRTIGQDAFRGCVQLADLAVPMQAAEIGEGALAGCGIRRMELPAVQEISAETFCGCERLRTFYLPSTVRRVGCEAFSGCTALERVCLEAELGNALGLEIGAGNEPLLRAGLHCGVPRAQWKR